MIKKQSKNNQKQWSIEDSAELYGLPSWGERYFSINKLGNICVSPKGSKEEQMDLVELIQELGSRNLEPPLLIRFDDILEDRLKTLHEAFHKAIDHYQYAASYQGVFPVKCNQQRHVVEELITCGRSWNFGLEAGSKAELLIGLSLIDNPKSLLICNGYKDKKYIETTILARQLNRQPVVVIEQADEIERIIIASKTLGAAPLLGIRAKLSSRSSGRWEESTGENSKFGLSIPEIVTSVNKLKEANLLKELKLLHFHIGSQINDIGVLKDALQEASQIYVELKKLGAPMGYLDVGGGLGVDYDGSRTATPASKNYSLQNYANDVVATIKESCQSKNITVPTLISESGRAIASHFSILVFNILGKNTVPSTIPIPRNKESLIIKNLRETLAYLNDIQQEKLETDTSKLQEAWNDALKFKDDALNAFRLGYIDLTERAIAEQLTWFCANKLMELIPENELITKEFKDLRSNLSSIYYANMSVFRSIPDSWAIDQLFPIMPIHRLNEKPVNLGHFADLTCDSDGKLAKFINNGKAKHLLELHKLKAHETYLIGVFMGGAYQEVMGNLHNLFGSTNAVHIRLGKTGGYQVEHIVKGNTKSDVLKAMEHDPEIVLERLRIASESAIQKGTLKIKDAQRFMDHLENSLHQSTYLQD